jgi:uncharacterized protein YecE (DUF72 family)
MTMTTQLSPSKDLGLRHVLETGLSVIRNEQVDGSRRDSALDRLIEIFGEAERGSQAVRAQNLLFATEERSAFEQFSMFFRYLDAPFGEALADRLSEAKNALGELRVHGVRDDERLRNANELIEKLIAAIKRDSALTPLEAPKTFQFR